MSKNQRRLTLFTIIVLSVIAILLVQLYAEGWIRNTATFVISVITLLAAIGEAFSFFSTLKDSVSPESSGLTTDAAQLIELQRCGDAPFNLDTQRLLVSEVFGNYFVSLLEKKHSYIHLPEQIELRTANAPQNLPHLAVIYEQMLNITGAQLLVIAAAGGMGKSTLAARIVRCLHEKEGIKLVLGDSAKTEDFNISTNEIVRLAPGYQDTKTFLSRLRAQLGMPDADELMSERANLREVKDRLVGEQGVILVDNLDTVQAKSELMSLLQKVVSNQIRVIVTTRQAYGFTDSSAKTMLVSLNSIRKPESIRAFLQWHIQTYQIQNHRLIDLQSYLDDTSKLEQLAQRTGGNPLLIQFATSEIARHSWDFLKLLPERLHGAGLLSYLYEKAWDELGLLGMDGSLALELLIWMVRQQYSGKKITSNSNC